MADISREEIAAKFEREEALRESMLVPVLAQTAIIVARLDGLDARADRIDQTLLDIKAYVSSLKSTIILTGISSVVAVTLGVAAFNAALQSNTTTSFAAGKETGYWQGEIRKEAEENRKWRMEMQQSAERAELRMQKMERQTAEIRAMVEDIKRARKPAPN